MLSRGHRGTASDRRGRTLARACCRSRVTGRAISPGALVCTRGKASSGRQPRARRSSLLATVQAADRISPQHSSGRAAPLRAVRPKAKQFLAISSLQALKPSAMRRRRSAGTPVRRRPAVLKGPWVLASPSFVGRRISRRRRKPQNRSRKHRRPEFRRPCISSVRLGNLVSACNATLPRPSSSIAKPPSKGCL